MCKFRFRCYYESLIASRVIALCQTFPIAVFLQIHPHPCRIISYLSTAIIAAPNGFPTPFFFCRIGQLLFLLVLHFMPIPPPVSRLFAFFALSALALISVALPPYASQKVIVSLHRRLLLTKARPRTPYYRDKLRISYAKSLLHSKRITITQASPSQFPPLPHKFALSPLETPPPLHPLRKAILAHGVPSLRP